MSSISVDYDVLNQKGSPAWYSDTFANIPTPGYKGRMFISTDTFAFYRDNGTGWDLVGGPGTGTITGAGVSGQVTYFIGTDTIGGNNNLFYDITNSRLGIGTATPGAPLDIHSTGTAAQFNGTGVNNSFVLFQNAGSSKWRIGNLYNSGANDYQIFDVTNSTARLTIKNTGASTLIGTFTATSLIKSGGTNLQILLADGSTTPTSTFGAGSVTNVSALTLGTTGVDLSSSVANSTTTPVITLNVPTASATNRGALSSADWTTFNNKQATLSLTTTGTSGAATLVGATLNIPNYTNVGTVTSVAALTLGTTGTDLSSSVANSTSTPVITLNVPTASATNRGALSTTDWTTFNNKQGTISVTAPVVLTGATISMPAATTSVSGYLTSTDWNTFNNKTSNLGTVTDVVALTIGTSGIDITSTAVTTTTTPVITLNIPTASASNRGALSSTDWTTFNNKQATLSLTTTGTSGVATLVANTLNVPNYGSALSGYVPYTGATTGLNLGAFSVTAADLIISDTYANDPLIKLVTTTSGNVEVQIRTATSTYNAGIGVVTSGYDFSIFTSNAQRLTIASSGNATFYNNVTLTNSIFPVLTVQGTASSPHIGSTWNVSANQDGIGRTIIGTAGQGRSMYFENNGDITIPNNSLSVATTGSFGGSASTPVTLAISSANSNCDITIQSSNSSSVSRIRNGTNDLQFHTNGTLALTLASNQAATFSSSVSLGGYLTGQGTNPGGLGGSRYVIDWLSDQMRVFSYGANTSTNGGFVFNSQRSDGTNSINYLDIASTGAATFSSSVRATQFAVTPSGTFRVNTDGDAILGYMLRSGGWKGNAENNLAFATDGAYGISFFTNGSVTERLLIASSGAATFSSTLGINGTSNNVRSGTYTPTLVAGTNCSAVTAYPCQYMQVDKVVTVSGQVYGSATAVTTETQFTMSVPVGSNFTQVYQCGGTGRSAQGGVAPSGAGYVAFIQAVSTDTVRFSYTAPAVLGTGGNFWFSFTYQII